MEIGEGMSARAKLTFSFCSILFLFGVNFAVYLWTVNRRNAAVENMDRSLNRVAVLSAVHKDLDNLTKEVALLGQLKFEESSPAPDPKDQQAFFQRVDGIQSKTAQLQGLFDPGRTREIDDFAKSIGDLAQSWKSFYENLGVHQGKAVTELAVRTDPLTEEVTTRLMPNLQRTVNEQAQAAKIVFFETNQWADQFTFFVFIISLTLASLLAVVGLQSGS